MVYGMEEYRAGQGGTKAPFMYFCLPQKPSEEMGDALEHEQKGHYDNNKLCQEKVIDGACELGDALERDCDGL